MLSPSNRYALALTDTRLFFLLCLLVFVLVSCGNSSAAKAQVTPGVAPPVHPAFTLDADDLQELVAKLPDEHQQRILARPQVFLELLDQVLDQPAALSVLVDKQHALAPDYAPEDLASLTEYPGLTLARNDLSLSAATMPMVLALNEAARRAGIELVFGSSYRSYRYQEGLFQRWVERLGREEAERVSAKPGHSQHQLGTVIDFSPISADFNDTAAYSWLDANAHRFGFSLSYPQGQEHLTGYDYESWHWRYIGRPGVRLQREFFGNLQQLYTEFLHTHRVSLESAREGYDQ